MKIFLAILGIIFIAFTLKSFWISHILSIAFSVATILCNAFFLAEDRRIPCLVFAVSVLYIFGDLIFDREEPEAAEGKKGRRCRAFAGEASEFFGFGPVICLVATLVAVLTFAFFGELWPPLCYLLPVAVIAGDVLMIKYLG